MFGVASLFEYFALFTSVYDKTLTKLASFSLTSLLIRKLEDESVIL